MGAAARYKRRDLAVLVQVRSSGRVQILTNHKFGVRMHKAARAIREAELRAQGRVAEIIQHADELENPGQLSIVPAWCYQMPGENLLNGSETACNLPKTLLSPIEICRIIQTYIEFAPADIKEGVEEAVASN